MKSGPALSGQVQTQSGVCVTSVGAVSHTACIGWPFPKDLSRQAGSRPCLQSGLLWPPLEDGQQGSVALPRARRAVLTGPEGQLPFSRRGAFCVSSITADWNTLSALLLREKRERRAAGSLQRWPPSSLASGYCLRCLSPDCRLSCRGPSPSPPAQQQRGLCAGAEAPWAPSDSPILPPPPQLLVEARRRHPFCGLGPTVSQVPVFTQCTQ